MSSLHGLPDLFWGECRVVVTVQSNHIPVHCLLCGVSSQCCISLCVREPDHEIIQEFSGISSPQISVELSHLVDVDLGAAA